jgi:endonuclease/exonuclease/phosphatase family metal-dependent hydrolase
MRKYGLILLLVAGISPAFCQQLTLLSYNVENFFHPSVDSLNPDKEYTPNGSRRWSYTRFNRKAEQIARVIAASVPNGYPDFIALNEVESDSCLIRLCRKMPHYPYRIIHFDSPDHRGIDVALLYDSTRCRLLAARPIRIALQQSQTRDLLYAVFGVNRSDTLHLIACHMPSQLGGYAASQWKRDSVKTIISRLADSIRTNAPSAKIVVCGDMNMSPKNDLPHFTNLMLSSEVIHAPAPLGTHKYQGTWTCLDQFYVSQSLLNHATARIMDANWLQEEDRRYLGLRPKRTFTGFRYNRNGYSDHLPILLELTF